jgi:hypothetical protein
MFLREDDVKTLLAEFLRSKNFEVSRPAPERSPGDDIVARSPQGRTLRIEVKGEGYSKAWNQGEIYHKVAPAVFNQLKSLHADKKRGGKDIFALAFPENRSYRIYLDEKMVEFLVGLGLLIFFVRHDGSVELCANEALPA